ncbi:hypothetical protein B7L68_05010 [Thermoproteus sp. CP80]|uniref:hypothetical protein n=1 Tax=Thermoproteus sp. CP80 TaxID=1650659 RepID=UPI0009BE2F25|nr:hypothetical protein [Thermoproteus sp. CP80]PLC64211.1 hypothetical protein B7L68_05010 [Thermoproteus sp. CP80]
MSETIWSFRVGGSIAGRAFAYGFIAFLALLLLLVALTSPPQYRLNNALGMAIFLAPLIAAALVIDRGFSRPFEVRFTEDGLAVGGRRRFYLPRDAVVGGGVVCIRRSPVGLELRISHGLVDYAIPLSQGQYDALVNALNTYWGWAPPECPRARFEPGATTTPMAPETTSSEGVLWRWGARKYGILYSIGLGGAVVGLFSFALVLSAIIGTIAWILHWVGGLATLIITVVVVAVVGVVALMTRGTLKWLFGSEVREIVLTYDGFTITDRDGSVTFIPRDDALDSICISGATAFGPYGQGIEYFLVINYNGMTYRVPMVYSDFTKLQEALSRAWGRGIRSC